MNLYVKLGLISFLAGTLGAGLTYGFNHFSSFFQHDLSGMFWMILPFILLGGLPSTVLLTWRVIVWKKSGKPEKGMSLYCFVVGLTIGLFAYPFLFIAGV